MKKTLAALGAVIAAIGGIFLAVGIRPHKDPGLQMACFDSNGAAHYSPTKACKAMKEIRWAKSQFPLTVSVMAGAEQVNSGSVKTAVENFNRQLGFGALVLNQQNASVQLILDAPSEPGWIDAGGDVRFRRNAAGVLSASMRICNPGDIATLHKVLLHEFGHVMGLAHDDFEDSAMWPTIGGERLGLRFTDGDRAILRRLYK